MIPRSDQYGDNQLLTERSYASSETVPGRLRLQDNPASRKTVQLGRQLVETVLLRAQGQLQDHVANDKTLGNVEMDENDANDNSVSQIGVKAASGANANDENEDPQKPSLK
jgi:hypothetical protein